MMKAVDLGLIDPAASCAIAVEAQCPHVVFTSGVRTRTQQAASMAFDTVQDRSFIADTYADSDAKRALLLWLNDNPDAKTFLSLTNSFESILNGLSDDQFGHLTLHGKRLAFDVRPYTCDWDTLQSLVQKFGGRTLQKEGSLVRWHVDFHEAGSVCFCH